MDETLSPEEIEAIAKRAGLKLAAEWRESLVEGSRSALLNKQAVRKDRDLSAEAAHIFSPSRN